MSISTEPFICDVCFKSYKRREHLHRHSLTHLAHRPYRCSTCKATFARTDVLRRHAISCSTRTSHITVSRRRKSCDRCAQQKKACSLGQPCRGCQAKAVLCRYTECFKRGNEADVSSTAHVPGRSWDLGKIPAHSADNTIATAVVAVDTAQDNDLNIFLQDAAPCFPTLSDGNDTLDWLNFLGVANDVYTTEQANVEALEGDRRFHFLYNFTSMTGLSETFECGQAEQRQRLAMSLSDERRNASSNNLLNHSHDGLKDRRGHKSSWLFDPLVSTIHDIVVRIKEVVLSKPRNSPITLSWTASIEEQCLDFFSPSNIRSCIASYWALWHPNVNFIHKPSFDPANAKASLVAAMVVIGKTDSDDTTPKR
jgi:hypothetical protein